MLKTLLNSIDGQIQAEGVVYSNRFETNYLLYLQAPTCMFLKSQITYRWRIKKIWDSSGCKVRSIVFSNSNKF